MVELSLEPTKWIDTIEASPECLSIPLSARNVEKVLSTSSTRKHQKMLLKAVEPFMNKMIEDSVGISILTSLVKYGTTTTVNIITKNVLNFCNKIINSQSVPVETCDIPLGILLERIIYREDCTDEYRISFINTLNSIEYSLLIGNSVLLLATARLIIIDREFAELICSNKEAQSAFLKLSSLPLKKKVVINFCEFLLSDKELKDNKLNDIYSSFIFNALSVLYESNSSLRPYKEITLLLASYGNDMVVRDMTKLISTWPDIRTRTKNEDYTKIMAFLLTRLKDVKEGNSLIKVIFKSKEDFEEKLKSQKTSSLQLLAAISEKPAYVATLTKVLGESQEKKLLSAAVRYRNATKPRAIATKEIVLQRLEKIRAITGNNINATKTLKRQRE